MWYSFQVADWNFNFKGATIECVGLVKVCGGLGVMVLGTIVVETRGLAWSRGETIVFRVSRYIEVSIEIWFLSWISKFSHDYTNNLYHHQNWSSFWLPHVFKVRFKLKPPLHLYLPLFSFSSPFSLGFAFYLFFRSIFINFIFKPRTTMSSIKGEEVQRVKVKFTDGMEYWVYCDVGMAEKVRKVII